MADYVEPLLDAVVAKVGDSAEFTAALDAVGAKSFYSDLTLTPPALVIKHFSEREVIYPHQQVYPFTADLQGELDVDGSFSVAIDTWLMGIDVAVVERSTRAYAAAIVDLLRSDFLDGLVTVVGNIQVRYSNTTVTDKGGRLGGVQVIVNYRMSEVPT